MRKVTACMACARTHARVSSTCPFERRLRQGSDPPHAPPSPLGHPPSMTALTAGTSCRAVAAALTKALMKPSLVPWASKNASWGKG